MDKKVSEDKVLYYEEIEEKKKMTKDELEKEARFRTKGWKEQENCVQAYIAGAKPRENENYQTQRKSEPCPLWCSHRDILTKANEIIKNLLTLSIPIDYAKCPGPLQKIAEAEQFLKEVSE